MGRHHQRGTSSGDGCMSLLTRPFECAGCCVTGVALAAASAGFQSGAASVYGPVNGYMLGVAGVLLLMLVWFVSASFQGRAARPDQAAPAEPSAASPSRTSPSARPSTPTPAPTSPPVRDSKGRFGR